MRVFSAAQFYLADQETLRLQGIASIDLMERAANQIFQWLHARMQGAQAPIKIFCGIGNNGGDGLALGRMLVKSGYNVEVYIANFSEKRSEDFLTNYDRYKKTTKDWPVLMVSENDFPEILPEDILVDCLFGIGLNRAPSGWVKKLIQYLNDADAFRLAVDIPSGLSADGTHLDPEAVIKANHTLTFGAPKMAFFLPETGRFVPYFEVLDIGLDTDFMESLIPMAQLADRPMMQGFYKQRQKFSHKGSYGHALIIGGSKGKMGAVSLSSRAAMKAGAGLVTAYVPSNGNDILQISVPEAMCLTDASNDTLTEFQIPLFPSAIAIGMGMGTAADTLSGFKKFLASVKVPIVLDADALNGLAIDASIKKHLPTLAILTPHEGELKRLIGAWKNDFEKWETAKKFSKKNKCILVIKGAHTLVLDGDQTYINTTGNPGMATAGSGDVLSGVVAGLLAQGYPPLEAALLGVYLHGSAGDIGAQEIGYEALTAPDMIQRLGAAFIALFEGSNNDQEEREESPSEDDQSL